VHQTASQTDHRCRDCGTPLAHDHGFDLFCSTCQRARCACDPRHDPTFASRLLELLKSNRRRPVNVYRELGVEPYGLIAWRCVQVHVRRFRRHGHRIIGRHDGTYEYRGQRAVRNGRARRRGRRSS
jgi:hypothetical protein